MTAAGNKGLPPVDALRVIARVCDDRGLTPAQRLAVVRVILHAGNADGLAWASYRAIRRETGLASATIREALRIAEGRYLARHAVGPTGAIQYRVALQPVKRPQDESASASEAGALHSATRGASACDDKLTPETNEGGAAGRNPPPAFVLTTQEDKPATSPIGELVALWVSEYERATGRPFTTAKAARTRLGGCLKNLLADHAPEDLAHAIRAWFLKDRGEYGIELFIRAMQGGDRDLLPRRQEMTQDPQALANGRKLAAIVEGTAHA